MACQCAVMFSNLSCTTSVLVQHSSAKESKSNTYKNMQINIQVQFLLHHHSPNPFHQLDLPCFPLRGSHSLFCASPAQLKHTPLLPSFQSHFQQPASASNSRVLLEDIQQVSPFLNCMTNCCCCQRRRRTAALRLCPAPVLFRLLAAQHLMEKLHMSILP